MVRFHCHSAIGCLRFISARDGMVDMSDLDPGDTSRVGSSPTARIGNSFLWSLYWVDGFNIFI